ncbi:MAG: glycosyltransferase family 2 protein, partial [Candidatus Omnitrophica bacterium]|nr:glycosyltransferase family 2 protein [Candidatus Omnitrophota bacterium]
MEKAPVSVVIITKNEEKRLRDCLLSVNWAKEIIIVDDESTDMTVDIAREYTDKIFIRKMDMEGAHRNFAYSKAAEAWILSLDADERVSEELKNEIIKIVTAPNACNGFAIPRKNYIGDYWIRYGGWYPSAQLKLFKNGALKYEEAEVHPRVFMQDPRGELKGDIIHYTYKNIGDFVSKLNKQTTLEAKKWIRDRRKMSLSRALRRTTDRFFRSYNKKQGKKDGIIGYVLAILGGFYQMLSYAKYWEEKLKQPPIFFKKIGGCPNFSPKKLSVVVLTKDCEADIANCLESVKWADEIIIIDGYSTDKTLDICRKYTNKIIQHKHEGDFAQERNIGIDNSTGDWVLQLDSDEIVTESLKKDIEQVLSDKEEPYAAYKFRRKNFFLGHFMRWGGWYHYSLHFLRKGKARYKGNIHEKMLVDGTIGKLEGAVEHYPFKSISQFVDRHNKYSDYEAKKILEEQGILSDD